ncbi:hypothetical protein BC943DRAFT_360377 [Umbelopsis sp. AD052]|nr:hypothetical protein BC943DRAFT_360377 [Umbelopsis sp. AD052]
MKATRAYIIALKRYLWRKTAPYYTTRPVRPRPPPRPFKWRPRKMAIDGPSFHDDDPMDIDQPFEHGMVDCRGTSQEHCEDMVICPLSPLSSPRGHSPVPVDVCLSAASAFARSCPPAASAHSRLVCRSSRDRLSARSAAAASSASQPVSRCRVPAGASQHLAVPAISSPAPVEVVSLAPSSLEPSALEVLTLVVSSAAVEPGGSPSSEVESACPASYVSPAPAASSLIVSSAAVESGGSLLPEVESACPASHVSSAPAASSLVVSSAAVESGDCLLPEVQSACPASTVSLVVAASSADVSSAVVVPPVSPLPEVKSSTSLVDSSSVVALAVVVPPVSPLLGAKRSAASLVVSAPVVALTSVVPSPASPSPGSLLEVPRRQIAMPRGRFARRFRASSQSSRRERRQQRDRTPSPPSSSASSSPSRSPSPFAVGRRVRRRLLPSSSPPGPLPEAPRRRIAIPRGRFARRFSAVPQSFLAAQSLQRDRTICTPLSSSSSSRAPSPSAGGRRVRRRLCRKPARKPTAGSVSPCSSSSPSPRPSSSPSPCPSSPAAGSASPCPSPHSRSAAPSPTCSGPSSPFCLAGANHGAAGQHRRPASPLSRDNTPPMPSRSGTVSPLELEPPLSPVNGSTAEHVGSVEDAIDMFQLLEAFQELDNGSSQPGSPKAEGEE